MARFRERFEVKNEMSDVTEINPDDNKQTGGQSSTQSQEDIKREANSIGFDDDLDNVDVEESLEEYRAVNSQVEAELEEYYDDDITQEELKAYLVDKITEIYGDKLDKCNILIDSFVEGFLENNEFNGAESYRQLARSAEETITAIMSKMKESKNIDDSKSEVPEQTDIEALSEDEARKLVSGYQRMSNQSELSANAYISTQAKKLGVDKKDLTSFVLTKGKEAISSPDKVLHYHRTSMQSFEQIMQTGYLLNRKNMQLNGIDVSRLSGSSSSNVQFSRDIYDSNGELQVEGYDKDSNLGANSTDVVFVMGPELMQEETYNCLSVYPTVEKADIQRCCVTILAKDPAIQMKIESLLKGKNMSIRTMLQEDFDRDTILEQISKGEESRQVEETGAILHSVNGKPVREAETGLVLKSVNGREILSSAIEATTETTRESTISQQAKSINIMQKERGQVAKDTQVI